MAEVSLEFLSGMLHWRCVVFIGVVVILWLRCLCFFHRGTYDGSKAVIHASVAPLVGDASGTFYSEMRPHRVRSDTIGEKGAQFGDRVWKDTISLIKPHLTVTDSWIYN